MRSCAEREAAFHVAEQFALDQAFRDRRAVHFDERLRRARAQRVQRVRRQFLACAALAVDQHTAVGARHQRELLAQGLHGHAVADDVGRAGRRFAKLLVLEAQAAVFERVLRDQQDAIDRKRLFEEIVSAQLGGFHRRLDGAVARNHDDHGPVRLRNLLNPVQRFQTIDAGQPDIQNHQFEDGAGEEIETGFAVLHGFDLKTFVFQDAAQGLPNARLVVDDQDAGIFHVGSGEAMA